ncbi:tetratricopeptide repeat protein [Verrucomicrobia bacterium]|nr:tetratricopeptide repeat protein [Verrucomicrobiota bacterium]MDG1890366.1 tetratricopeptide repeat protein [Verrucomicrobiota bacterium]
MKQNCQVAVELPECLPGEERTPLRLFGLLVYLCFWLAGVGVIYPSSESVAMDPESLTRQVRDAVVTIRHMDRNGHENGVGTGFVIDSKGLIATSLHVIGEARSMEVVMADGSRHQPIEVYAWDRTLDLAVIRLDLSSLSPLPLGDSDALEPGEQVIAVGNPMGLERSVVNGLISGFRRFDHARMIQLAIPIEPGNSGGPVFNQKGEVLGLLNMKSTLTPNLGFATPINALKPLLQRPNSVSMSRWLRLGALDVSLWSTRLGALWSSKVDRIAVQGQGQGFGGRSLCHFHLQPQTLPYELEVRVKLGDESGAAGLIFGSDGADRHYGFYPSNHQLRLTRFDGPTVYDWNILNQVRSVHYREGAWNDFKIRHEASRILCYVNGHLVIDSTDSGLGIGKVGLAKFRDTQADYAGFQLHTSPESMQKPIVDKELGHMLGEFEALFNGPETSVEAWMEALPGQSPEALQAAAEALAHRAEQIRWLAFEAHQNQIRMLLKAEMVKPEQEINLMRAALLIAQHDRPKLNITAYEHAVDRMAVEIRSRGVVSENVQDLMRSLLDYLFKENGFHGSFADYENAENSYLDKVIDDREGLPITLSVLLIELAERLGIQGVSGLPLPGHFLVRYAPKEGQVVLIDAFNMGNIMTFAEADTMALQYQERPTESASMSPASKKDIVLRMLANLRYFAQQNESLAAALPYLDLMIAIDGEDANLRLERATIRLRTGRREGARSDFRWLLDRQPEGVRLDRIREALEAF